MAWASFWAVFTRKHLVTLKESELTVSWINIFCPQTVDSKVDTQTFVSTGSGVLSSQPALPANPLFPRGPGLPDGMFSNQKSK
jgi:hypothetical protein